MSESQELFGGEGCEQLNALHKAFIAAAGGEKKIYAMLEKTPKTTLIVRLVNRLHDLGFQIVAEGADREALEKAEYAGIVKAMDGLKCEDCDGSGGDASYSQFGPCQACDGSGWNDEVHEVTCEDVFDQILKA